MEKRPEETLSEIRQMMERSSRFRSLSGISFIAAGICGLLGVWWINKLMGPGESQHVTEKIIGGNLISSLLLPSICTLIVAVIAGLFFTLLKIKKRNLPLGDVAFKRVSFSFAIPMITGGIFIIGMLVYHQYQFIATACLLFYGLALFNASHYTLKEIRYLGIAEIIAGIICLFAGYELLLLAIGFGVMNILSGLVIWKKYPE